MFIPDPDFYPSRILDPKTATKESGEKKFAVIRYLYLATNFTKLKIILFLKCWRKKIWASFQTIIELFTPKFVNKLKNMGLDPRSRIQCCAAGAESRGTEIKLPPRAGAEITNCGSGSCLFIKDFKKFFRKKLWLLKKFFWIITILILFGYNNPCVLGTIHVKMYWCSSQKR